MKHAFSESDETLLNGWVENPSWQNVCRFDTLQHYVRLHSTSPTKGRKRVGTYKLAEMLQVTQQELTQVNFDTNV